MNRETNYHDLNILSKNWAKIRKVIIKILRKRAKKTIDITHSVPMVFDRDLVLGTGKWGLVVGLPSLEEIVIKITTDPFEWYLMELIMQDDELRNHPAVPFTIGTSVLDMKSNGMPLYLIVRENLHIGIPLNLSNPLIRMKDMLIDQFVSPMEDIENEVASILNKNKNLNLIEVSMFYSLMNGEIKKQIGKAKAKLPRVSKDSKFYNVLDFQKKLLDRGIALIDIHVNNLGTRQFSNLNKLFNGVGKLDMENVVISDLGMAYGTPIFLQAGMAYKDVETMIKHLAGILKDYSESRASDLGIRRSNPALYSVKSVQEDLIFCCQEANLKIENVLFDIKSNIHIDKIVANLMKMIPRSHLDVNTVAFVIKGELIAIIKQWIAPYDALEIDDKNIYVKCFVDSIKNGMAKCRLSHDLSFNDEAPVGCFVIPQTNQLAEDVLNFFKSDLKRRSSKMSVQHIPLIYLNTMNGVEYENIQGIGT